jgi:hypothetical protein
MDSYRRSREVRRFFGAIARVARGHRRLLIGAAALLATGGATAFTFVDGTSTRCTARGGPVAEIAAPPGHPVLLRGRIALTEPTASGYRIIWNEPQLKTLPPEMHDFIFFHECAHALVPTNDELTANCVGLQIMRAAGRAGFAVESRLAAFYGPASLYWQKTLECANAREPVKLPEPAG